MTAAPRAVVIAVVVAFGVLLAAHASAEPRKVFVMPVDGPVDPATRERLNAAVQKTAHASGGTVTNASTTYAETASMVGCDPAASGCSDTVLATLQADEIVWGTATVGPDGSVTLVTHRAAKGAATTDTTTKLAASAPDSGHGAEPGSGTASGSPSTAGTASDGSTAGSTSGAAAAAPASVNWSRDKKLGVGLAIVGGAAVVIGFALWGSESSVQSQINAAPDNTLAQIQSLRSLESTASNYAWSGNVLVVVGLAAGGVGAYYLWKDHKAHVTTVAATPVAHGTGGALVIGGQW